MKFPRMLSILLVRLVLIAALMIPAAIYRWFLITQSAF
jgi:hypothetical protein